MRLPTDSPEIEIWCAFSDQIVEPALLQQYRSLLSQEELEQLSSFLLDRERHRYLLTRTLLRCVLSRYADVAPIEWRFTTNRFGRPQIVNDQPDARELTFNVSHTNGLVVLGVTRRLSIGVDTENVTTRDAPFDIAKKFLSSDEVASLLLLPKHLQQRRFYEYWTLKESYAKARSVGLSIPLHKCRIQFGESGQLGLSIDPDVDCASRWQLWQCSIGRDYVIAVCSERPPSVAPRIGLKEIVPLRHHFDLTSENVRSSGEPPGALR